MIYTLEQIDQLTKESVRRESAYTYSPRQRGYFYSRN